MSHTRIIPKVKDCIAYIEGCGWKYSHYNRPWYAFESAGTARTMTGGKMIYFTLHEIRHALTHGW